MYCVYKITDLRNNEIIYIGKTKDFNRRKYYHFSQTFQQVQRYMYDNDRSNFEMTVVKDNIETNKEALIIEDELIVELNPIMNVNRSGLVSKELEYHKEYQKKYRDDHSEEYKEYHKEYRNSHSEIYKAYQKEYQKEYRKKHIEEYKAYQKEYKKSHKSEQSAKSVELW